MAFFVRRVIMKVKRLWTFENENIKKKIFSRLAMSGDAQVAKSIFCMPIRDPDDKVLGVISLINKEKDGEFTDNDAR